MKANINININLEIGDFRMETSVGPTLAEFMHGPESVHKSVHTNLRFCEILPKILGFRSRAFYAKRKFSRARGVEDGNATCSENSVPRLPVPSAPGGAWRSRTAF